MCNLDGCVHPGPHVHLRKSDEQAIANVLLAEWARRQGRREQRLRRESRLAANETETPDAT